MTPERVGPDFVYSSSVWLSIAERMEWIKAAAVSVIDAGAPPAVLACEIGASIMFAKPIIVIATAGAQIPTGLRQIAMTVIEGTTISDKRDELLAAVATALDGAIGKEKAPHGQ